jgi:hypothetical protein
VGNPGRLVRNPAWSQPRCEIAKTILDEECERPGEVRYAGMPLCGPHAELLGLQLRAEALLGAEEYDGKSGKRPSEACLLAPNGSDPTGCMR